MSTESRAIDRRGFLRFSAAVGTTVPLAVFLASCASSSGGSAGGSSGGKTSASNPFGVKSGSSVDAVIFDGGYGTAYATAAAAVLAKGTSKAHAKITGATQISQQMQPRFVGGNPPDLLDDTGANAIGISTLLSQLEDLTPVIDAKSLEGTTIKDTLYAGVLADSTYGTKLAAINYVLTVYGLWYSKSLFDANGWTPPKTWDEAMTLGAAARKQDKYLFAWGKEAAAYYLTMAVDSAIKEGGDQVRIDLGNLTPKSWSAPAMKSALKGIKAIIDAGYIKPGGAGTQFTAAQAQWSLDQSALLYPSGSWIESEMKKQTKSGFEMTGSPTPTVTASSALPFAAIHNTASETFVVPSKAANAAGGKELLRVMLSKEAATDFARRNLTSTIVKDTVPADGFGSSALKSQVQLLGDSGSHSFSWSFLDVYGMSTDMTVLWNTFLSGGSSVAELTSAMQALSDKVRNDSSITKVKVTA